MGYSQYKIVDNPWLKKVPSTWDMIPNKVLFTKRQVKVGENFYKYQLLSLTTQGIKEKDINDVKGKVPASYNNYQMVRPGDMVFCLFDLDVSAVFAGVSPYSGMITSAYDVAECNEEYIIPQYMNYWFQYVFFGRHYKMYTKNVRYTLSFDAFGSIKTPVPPRAEQDQIVRYLDWKVSEINRLINLTRDQINKLKELNFCIISNSVMNGVDDGKIIQDDSISRLWDHEKIGHKAWIRARLGWRGLKATEYVDEGYPFLSAKFGPTDRPDRISGLSESVERSIAAA